MNRLKKLRNTLIFFALFSSIVFCANKIPTTSISNNSKHNYCFDSILYDSLQSFVKNFTEAEFPFELTTVPQTKEIEENYVRKFVHSTDHLDEILNKYYYGYVLYNKDYLVLISSFQQTQGLSSMDNWYLRIHNFNYNGRLIDTRIVACNCNSKNLSKNEFYSKSFNSITINVSGIVVHEIKTHATLLPDEGENTFENIKNDSVYFRIDNAGNILPK